MKRTLAFLLAVLLLWSLLGCAADGQETTDNALTQAPAEDPATEGDAPEEEPAPETAEDLPAASTIAVLEPEMPVPSDPNPAVPAEAEELIQTSVTVTEDAATGDLLLENSGYTLRVPTSVKDDVEIELAPEMAGDSFPLFDIYDQVSIESCRETMPMIEHRLLFSIFRTSMSMKQARAGYHDRFAGEQFLGYDGEGNWYLMYEPTDSLMSPEADQALWERKWALDDWTVQAVDEFLQENGLTEFSPTELERALFSIAYSDWAMQDRELRSVEAGSFSFAQADGEPWLERLFDGSFELLEASEEEDTLQQVPDGESLVLACHDQSINADIRIDFFKADGNLVRFISENPNHSYYQLYRLDLPGDETALDILEAWYAALKCA